MSNGNTIGEAYLQIRPSMEGVKGEIEQAMGDAGSKSSGSFGAAFSSGIKKTAAVTAAAVGAAAGAVGALTKNAVSDFADYEQLVGGVETLFKDDASAVLENANKAFTTAGLSANEYMETVTSFSASLLQSLEGDTDLAVGYADQAIRDMSDNANKMGTSMESIQTAYAGFAKGNFTMLDNLKLGYGGTKEEMERLLRDAESMEGYIEGSLSIDSFSDIIEAINIVQDNLGITGTTAKEASSTISGSIASMGSAWTNLVAGLANPDADLGQLIDNFVDTALTALDNLIPAITNALPRIGEAINKVAPIIAEKLPELLNSLLPVLIDSAISLVNALVQALPQILTILMEQLPTIISMICDTVLELLPMIVDLGLQLILALADGLIQNLPELIPALVDVILQIVEKLTDPDTLLMLIDAALQLIVAIAEGLMKALPKLLEKAPVIIKNLVTAIIAAIPMILEAAAKILVMLGDGISAGLSKIKEKGKELVSSIKEGFQEKVEQAKEWGKDLIKNFISGITGKISDLKESVTNVAGKIKDFLHFSEPDEGPLKDFHTYAPDMMKLFAQGIEDNVGVVQSALNDMTGTVKSDFAATANVEYGTTAAGVAPVRSDADLYGLLARYLPFLADRTNVSVELKGDANGIFQMVRNENNDYMRRTGQRAFA